MTGVSLAASPIPVATVAPAPAAAPVIPVAGAAGIAPAVEAGATARLDVPAEFLARLEAAAAEGVADATTFANEHSPAERWMVPDWAMLKMKWPPKTDAEDLQYLHGVADARTPVGVARAQYWSKHGLVDEWEALLDDYVAKVGPAQARSARKLLHDALMMMNTITQTAKAGAARQRPFVVDPTLKLAVDRPGNNPSYPSGHTTAAYAAAIVLSHLMPDRRAEFMGMATEASWARVYAGVHFPTDVLAGAKLATTVATHLVRTSMTVPRRGTKPPAGNPGVAGAAPGGALPGAAQLAGPRIAGAVMGQGQPGT